MGTSRVPPDVQIVALPALKSRRREGGGVQGLVDGDGYERKGGGAFGGEESKAHDERLGVELADLGGGEGGRDFGHFCEEALLGVHVKAVDGDVSDAGGYCDELVAAVG
jgi:hypothetical protein